MPHIDHIPEFAIIGHPNEGKSSVVSTLAEDDSVRISPVPGETVVCQTFPVVIDGREIIRFADTPGFQNPGQTLDWMRQFSGGDERIVSAFRKAHAGRTDFRDDVELFEPVERGAGIIYVVDGSRPLRKMDKSEMEVLRLTGRPRMAIINAKEDHKGYLDQWKNEFRKHFNSVRIFNAHKATYAERISLLESLKSIEQDWQPALETVISAFTKDWDRRNTLSAEIIVTMIKEILNHVSVKNFTKAGDEEAVRSRLQEAFNKEIERMERNAHQKIRRLFKHNIFNYDLPPYSILNEDLFNDKTWQFLGLNKKQLITAAGLAGGALGATVDVAALGHTLGLGTILGGLAGAGWAAMGGGRKLASARLVGASLGGHQIQVGPIENIQFLYILLDRALIFYSHIINWAHGRRDYPETAVLSSREPLKQGITTEWEHSSRKICGRFYSAIRNGDDGEQNRMRTEMIGMLKDALYRLSTSERRYGLIMNGS